MYNNSNRNYNENLISPDQSNIYNNNSDDHQNNVILPSVASGFNDDEASPIMIKSFEPPANNDVESNQSSASVGEKLKFWKQPFFKDKMGIIIFVAIGLINVISTGILLPILFTSYVSYKNPHYTPSQIESEASRLKSISDSMPYLANFIFSPLLGSISDRYGRKIVLFIIQLLQLIDVTMIGLGYWKKFIIPIYISHTLSGVSNGMLSVAFSYLADITSKEDRAPWFMAVGVGLGFSLIVGPLILMALIKHSYEFAVYGSGAFLVISILALLPLTNSIRYADGKPKSPEQLASKSSASLNPFKSIYGLFKSSKYTVCYAILFISFSFTLQDTVTTSYYYTELKFGWGASQNSIVTCLTGVFIVLYSGFIIPLVLKFISDRKLVAVCFFTSFAFHFFYAFAINQYMWAVPVVVGAFSLIVINLIQSIISKATPSNIQGVVLSGVSSITSLTSAAGAFASQNLFSYFISSKSPIYFPGMHFLINAGIIFITFIFSVVIIKIFPNPDKVAKLIVVDDEEAEIKKPILDGYGIDNTDDDDDNDINYKVGGIN
ncbi:hypothetical protein PPL_10510 [Heterostelium album PN500]|uniref:Major facilitator superfamily (MFS) profile domain-containing protein n=1 Tax=Heterostelium pallidum (strain ATCC 26659 / Pp 5 / PN500) TaxID=670386 RepID=D3BRA4_HETP5|nr:hypothetical protein PPL_10510 [Heterostelium album PN500]EFA75936.1 hypothetical protein PPL_10510 [Heterostelium album PN500]|eukprot:XP_020428070.1 hypothetical protein PPL_10510 [Heterostelium album PN500]